MKKGKIYLRVGIGFFILFMITAYTITDIQTRHNYQKMRNSFSNSSIELRNHITRAAEGPFSEYWTLGDMMFSINNSICGLGEQWSGMNMYSSILLLDENKEVITRSGNVLRYFYSPSSDSIPITGNFTIPLNKYCSEEQTALLCKEFNGFSREAIQCDITGYSDKWGVIPQKITINHKGSDKNLTLEFDNTPSENTKIESWSIDSAMLRVQGFGQKNRALTEKEKCIIKECEAAGYDELSKLSGLGRGTAGSDFSHFTASYASRVCINGETCYLVMGVQGFPQKDAMIFLISTYIFLFILMLILFFIVSHSFIKIYKQQMELETTRYDLINAVAHELKTPLGVIRNYSESLKEKINEEKKEHYLEVIQDETERMGEMISDMFELSQLESQVKLTLRYHSLNSITEGVLARYHALIVNKGISAVIVSSDNYMINCDAKLIEQVVSNFLSNAIQYTPENGNIIIKINNKDGQTVFTIENSGQNIPADKISHIWDAFYKVDTSRSNPNGTGLGLSIAKSILNAHGFEYGVVNTESGVAFWFTVK